MLRYLLLFLLTVQSVFAQDGLVGIGWSGFRYEGDRLSFLFGTETVVFTPPSSSEEFVYATTLQAKNASELSSALAKDPELVLGQIVEFAQTGEQEIFKTAPVEQVRSNLIIRNHKDPRNGASIRQIFDRDFSPVAASDAVGAVIFKHSTADGLIDQILVLHRNKNPFAHLANEWKKRAPEGPAKETAEILTKPLKVAFNFLAGIARWAELPSDLKMAFQNNTRVYEFRSPFFQISAVIISAAKNQDADILANYTKGLLDPIVGNVQRGLRDGDPSTYAEGLMEGAFLIAQVAVGAKASSGGSTITYGLSPVLNCSQLIWSRAAFTLPKLSLATAVAGNGILIASTPFATNGDGVPTVLYKVQEPSAATSQNGSGRTDFDKAREKAFEEAGIKPEDVDFGTSPVDETGTVTGFRKGDKTVKYEINEDGSYTVRVETRNGAAATSAPASKWSVSMSHKAVKAMEELDPVLKEKANEFIRSVQEIGFPETRKRPGFHVEKVLNSRQAGEFSVRLNQAFRMFIRYGESDGLIEIVDINRHAYKA